MVVSEGVVRRSSRLIGLGGFPSAAGPSIGIHETRMRGRESDEIRIIETTNTRRRHHEFMIDDANGRRLKTTKTSLEILGLILEHGGLTLAELDRMIDRPKSSVYSHLNTLRDSRYLVKSDGTYYASFRLTLLGEKAKRRYPRESAVREVVDRLAETTGKEANFTVFEHGRLLLFYGTSSEGDDREREADVTYRSEYYLHNTAAGKAILAELDRSRVERILDEWGMPRESEATITDRERLFDALEEIADRKFAVVDEEFAPGLVSIGAPVHDENGNVVGGLSVGGPKYQIEKRRTRHELGDRLLDAVRSLEASIAR